MTCIRRTRLFLLAGALMIASTGAAHAQTKDVVRIPFPQDDGSLTPYTFTFGYPLVTLVYDTLMWRDESGTPRPWLARDVNVTNGGRRVTVSLQRGVRWHDGTKFTAADVEFTFDYMRTRYHPRFTPQLQLIDEVTAENPNRVVFALGAPSAAFLDQPLSDVSILPRHLWEALDAGDVPPGHPVGTGPYRLVRHRKGKLYRFRAHPGYFLGAPNVRRIDVPIVPDAGEMIERLEDGAVDMVPLTLPNDAARRLEDLGADLATGPYYVGTTLVFNLRRPPFDDAEVRRAVSAALDLRGIARAAGGAVPAEFGLAHPESPWATQEPLHRFDRSAARGTLTALDLPTLEVLAPDNDPVRTEAGRRVVLALRAAGAEARLETVARDELATALGEDSGRSEFELALWSSPPLVSYDPDFLATMFGSDPEGAPLNVTGYASDRFDRLARRVATTTDPDARRAAVADELRLLAHDAPVVPLLFARGIFAYNPRAYDSWTFVDGAGILDKLSFIDIGAPDAESGRTPNRAVPRVRPKSGLPPLTMLSLGVFAAFVIAAAVAVLRARNRQRS
ncbi:MAG TPA: ABC transporter substrate-binding protein [Actinomycetota bacterium]|nr:ABC transporter substrate-binding protein [Actinomycetota bacterium]